MLDRRPFINPPNEHRGAPFWSINDRLDPEEVRRQVRLLVEAGYGGAFFHAREGLVTPFLSEEWFTAFQAAVKEAEKLGAFVWIYDELRWPSGFAGGIVPAKNPRYRAKALVAACSERAFKGVVAAFRILLDEKGVPVGYERAEEGEVGRAPLYLSFVEYTAQPGETWYEGFSYVDLLDAEVVREFITEAYEPYLKFKEYFGNIIPGVFTDEPNIESSRPSQRVQLPPRGPRFPSLSIPWTDNLPKRFTELNGYSILEKLPELLFDVGDFMKTRYDFWKTVTLMFVEAFSKQVYEWCEKHGLKFTGHYLAEDTLLSQLRCAGAVMPHYEYQHVPGVDHLGFQIWHTFLTIKQVASVANQLGREKVLCEAYGCLGNYPTFADRKWIGDYLYVLGVNFLNHHLVPYSLRGRRKRDYGLNFHWSQPWWRYNRVLEDYFARLSYILSQGFRVVNVLVLHPMGSAWALYTPLAEKRVEELNVKLLNLLKELVSLHIDFDLGDEILLSKHASVVGSKLKVGRMLYDAVIVPPCVTLASTTLKLLQEFVEEGGTLVFVERVPERVDGVPSGRPAKLAEQAHVITQIEKLALEKALRQVPKRVVIEGDERGSVLYHLRKIDDRMVLYLVNTDKSSKLSLKVGLEGHWKPEVWDALTGEAREVYGQHEGGRTWVGVELHPIGSTLIVYGPGTAKAREIGDHFNSAKELLLGEGCWKLKRLDPNVLVLDYCRFSVEGGSWSDLIPIHKAQREVVSKGVGTRFTLRFEFECRIDPKVSDISLVVESPWLYEVEVNGKRVDGWGASIWDPSFRSARISDFLVAGLNTVELHGTVGLEPEFEPIYLVGDFGVVVEESGSLKMVEEKQLVNVQDLCSEGLPFYAGSVELSKSFEVPESPRRAVLKFEDLNASLAEVHVNGVKVGLVFLPPYEIDVTSFVKTGRNEVKVVLVGTLRNLFGPLHYMGGDPMWIGPEAFRDEPHWTDEYVLKPFGFKGLKLTLYY